MSGDNRKDFSFKELSSNLTNSKDESNSSLETLDFSFISLISNKIRVLIVGGGEAGYIKTKSFIAKGCNVWVLATRFDERFDEFHGNGINIIKDTYKESYILDKHLIVIAIEECDITKIIQKQCENLSKLYVTCHNFRDGNFVVPMQLSSKEVAFALNVKKGNPSISRYMAGSIVKSLNELDGFVDFANYIRKIVKEETFKKEILKFISNEDFEFYFDKGYSRQILVMFYPRLINLLGVELIEYENCYKEK
ncbi:NAD(P)-dependent oxidoreductase [Clostridium algidicarnis]|uniref:precorrin-2 dehydrogenase n=2 Tax=Clostridium algidicarnis TaxID=37659 RepID=A0A2S6FX51_9CLOT|nr:NAD(P)-dependent oxidoreductase [Clostridium algidicarnis]MBB6630276.1 NAD(P)-dependent oxidoreductase [Clostridium algidicarnis]MBB6697696.1 NAD(P)-dependent oxidoreductase [Clostridium algidicarnis]MBU3192906.1 NAD(P)-dependent oxidoreductase [Clostridium algidicarnis]MBU3203492.1 NAD(P)-dependent oxidoreductase [Clostridium algidicarnis]MBU3206184.1 NAD(P)-dependent oxidoreductase [Clostridium algidicarnis]